METKVYIEDEKVELLTQPDEWCEKLKELEAAGLKLRGQNAFTPAVEVEEEKTEGPSSVVPFRKMTAEMVRVYKEVCPEHDEVTSFNKEPIPLKALGAIALAVKEKYFKKIEVWHSDHDPDPLVVGFLPHPNKEYTWMDGGVYLLAQWGPEIEAYADARKRAMASWTERAKAAVKAEISRLQHLTIEDALGAEALRWLQGKEAKINGMDD